MNGEGAVREEMASQESGKFRVSECKRGIDLDAEGRPHEKGGNDFIGERIGECRMNCENTFVASWRKIESVGNEWRYRKLVLGGTSVSSNEEKLKNET
jgi:hypothetical protein